MIKAAGMDKWVPAKPGAVLNSGDAIQTKEGMAEVVYPDESVLKVKNDTSMTLSELKDGGTGQLTRKIKIMVGDIWAKITPGTSTRTEFETPTTVAAVKGTVVSFSVDANGVTQIMTQTGLVKLQIGESMSIDLGGGKAVQVAVTENGASITGLQGTTTINLFNGTSIKLEPNVTVAGPLNKNNLQITTTAGTATVTGRNGTKQDVRQGQKLVISPNGTFGIPVTDTSMLRNSLLLNQVPQQNTTNSTTSLSGKDYAPSNNNNPYVNPAGGNMGDKKDISPSNP